MNPDKQEINNLIDRFFEIFNNKDLSRKDWTIIYKLCIPEALIIKQENEVQTIYNLKSFIEPRIEILTSGTLINFEEHETSEETIINGNIAQRISKYEKSGIKDNQKFSGSGVKLFQLVKTNDGWKISSLCWEDD